MLAEHLKQSRKYQYVAPEIKHYMGIDILTAQPLPKGLLIQAYVKQLLLQPVYAVGYIGILFYTRFFGKNLYQNATRFWDTDASTKEL